MSMSRPEVRLGRVGKGSDARAAQP
jgi:hypothetical protein